MISKIQTKIAPPVFEDEEKSRIARLLNIISLSVIALLGGLAIANLVQEGLGTSAIGIGSVVALMFVVQFIMRRGYVKAAGLLLVAVSWLVLTYLAWQGDGVRDTALIAYVIIILLAGLLIGWHTGLVFAGFSILSGWGLAYAEVQNIKEFSLDAAYDIALDATVIFALVTIILALATVGLQNALKRARHHERSLEKSNRDLQALSDTLENRVADRTRGLELVAVLSEELISILNVEEMLSKLVNRLKSSFRYSYVLVYLFDDERTRLVLTAGSGGEGEKLMAGGHYILPDEDTTAVAQAARSHRTVKVDDIHQVESRLSTFALPNTRSEMAVPIILEGQVVGALDVQRSEAGAIDANDVNLLRPLVNQVAIAIRNARLFQQVETALSEAYEIQERYTEQAWDKAKMIQRGGEYQYVQPGVSPSATRGEEIFDEIFKDAVNKRGPVIAAFEAGDAGKQALVAPITLRDDVIGSLQLQSSADHQWAADDLEIIEAIIDQMGQTADNLRLFDETKERAGREQTLREITDKMRGAINLEELVKITAQELGQRFSAEYTLVDLGIDQFASPGDKSGNGHKLG